MLSFTRRLPDAELEVMQAIWDCEPPVSRADIVMGVEDRVILAPALMRLYRMYTARAPRRIVRDGCVKAAVQTLRRRLREGVRLLHPPPRNMNRPAKHNQTLRPLLLQAIRHCRKRGSILNPAQMPIANPNHWREASLSRKR